MRTQKTQKKPISHNFFEKKSWTENRLVCGIDEVGRGCLAGPLVVAAAILPQKARFSLLKDSKKLTELQRKKAFAWIQKRCLYATAVISWKQIDAVNIYQATIRAMKKALCGVITKLPNGGEKLQSVLIDAMPLSLETNLGSPDLQIHYFSKGEQASASIAAASIVAKVTRDTLMEKMDSLFPAMRLGEHKGYGTLVHHRYLQAYGPSIIHRSSFLSANPTGNPSEEDLQKMLF